ncbi:MAG: alpha/beta hydrolase [Alphaproteobacteria bacterium]|nr:alpha/beta hydrolase [Alphaproteobacteria bacterium]
MVLLTPVVLSLLAGCAPSRDGFLFPLRAATNDASRVDMLVATTRKPTEDPGRLFSGDRGDAISIDRLVVSIPPDRNRKIGEVQWPSQIPPRPENEFALLESGKIASEQQALQWFRRNRNAKKQAIIFVHGFNTTYAEAVFLFAQVVHDSGTDAAPILFTWPSRGSVFDYHYDKESSIYSRRALEDLILQAARSPDVSDITILAHSMGGWLTAEALRGVAMRDKTIPDKVRNVILASPDIDVDVFRRQVAEMGARRPHFTIFTSTEDKALGISRLIAGDVERVGGVDLRPYAADLERLGTTVIDTSATDSHDPLGHSAFADSPEMIRLLGRRIAGQSLQGGRVSLADRVGLGAIGTVDLARAATQAAVTARLSTVIRDAQAEARQEQKSTVPKIVNGQVSY